MTYIVIPEQRKALSVKEINLLETTLQFFDITYTVVKEKSNSNADYTLPIKVVCESALRKKARTLLRRVEIHCSHDGLDFNSMTVGDFLEKYTRSDVLKWRGFGPVTFKTLADVLKNFGYEWY